MTRLPDRAALGTMHGKGAAIAPPFARLGIALVVPAGLDTDRFGTFSGEVPRAGTMDEAARAKALAAIAATGLPAALASEGAYGPHPALPFLPFGQELLLWREAATGREVAERLSDPSPAYDQATVESPEAVAPFLARAGFPGVAVVVAPAQPGAGPTRRGLRAAGAVEAAVRAVLRAGGPARLFTDMRAHMNPRRMATIARLAERLAARLAAACPDCGAPGWGAIRSEPGLPCAACGAATPLVLAEVLGCTACGAEARRPRPDGRTAADPAHCAWCNP